MPKIWFSFSTYKLIKCHHLLHKLVSISPSPSPNFISIRYIHLIHFNRINYLGSRIIPVINVWISFTCNMCRLYAFLNCVCVLKYFLFSIGCSCVCAKLALIVFHTSYIDYCDLNMNILVLRPMKRKKITTKKNYKEFG